MDESNTIVVNTQWVYQNVMAYFNYKDGDPHAEELDIGEHLFSLATDVFGECGFEDVDMTLLLPDGYTAKDGRAPITLESLLYLLLMKIDELFDHHEQEYRTMNAMWWALHTYLQQIGLIGRSLILGFDYGDGR